MKSKLEPNKPKEQSLYDSYQDTLCTRRRGRLKPLKSTDSEPSNGVNHVINGPEKKTQAISLMEALMSGGGKVTSWRNSGKIRTWSRLKFFLRVKAVARQVQDSLKIPPGETVALSFHHIDLDFVVAFLGCLMAGVAVVAVPTPEHCSPGVALQEQF